MAYSKYDPSIQFGRTTPELDEMECPLEMGYKGLGTLLAQILVHTEANEVACFWILVSLLENYELRLFFQPGLPGVTLMGEVFQTLLERNHPEPAAIFARLGIDYSLYFPLWAKTLLSLHVPINCY